MNLKPKSIPTIGNIKQGSVQTPWARDGRSAPETHIDRCLGAVQSLARAQDEGTQRSARATLDALCWDAEQGYPAPVRAALDRHGRRSR